MSPRSTGIAVITASVVAGVGAGFLISRPPWSIGAALMLTAASVGMAFGILLLHRTSWADKTWPPGPIGEPNVPRRRRFVLIVGIVAVALTPVVIALGITLIATGDVSGWAILPYVFYAVIYPVLGTSLMRMSRKPRAD